VKENNNQLSDKSLMLVFSYSPAGLGHLRVTEALYDGLPVKIEPILLGSQDKNITNLHRLVSLHPLVRSLFEWAQSRGYQEYLFTKLYRLGLHRGAQLMYKQIVTLLEQRIERPKTLLIVATHFGLAHQVSVIKEKIAKEQKIRVILVVIVTDDSPQFIWYVDRADLIFVPSSYTKRKLMAYAAKQHLNKTEVVVNPYPVNPVLKKDLSSRFWQERVLQLNPKENFPVNIVFPVSGAAVGMDFFVKLVDLLYQKNSRYLFHVVAKTSLYTLPYLNELMSRPYVQMHLANTDRETVNLYEKIYQKKCFSLEITKPSEQAFKCLIPTNKVGGSLLLFAEPVGRQEIDNLNFMVKHKFIPNLSQQRHLWSLANKNVKPESLKKKEDLWQDSRFWRGVVLPHHSINSAQFIWWCWRVGLFEKMIKSSSRLPTLARKNINETDPSGAELFWQKVNRYLSEK
jgi:hypothetical protein